MNEDEIKQKLNKIEKSAAWGTYILGQFYFKINTNKKKADFSFKGEDMPVETQKKLQEENYPAIFHEYVHFIHEVSTVQGTIGLFLNISKRSLFSELFEPGKESVINKGLKNCNENINKKLSKILTEEDLLYGSNDTVEKMGRFVNIDRISKKLETHFIPYLMDFIEEKINIPVLHYKMYNDKRFFILEILFGKFYIFEGIAYELDRIVDMQVKGANNIDDKHKATEYTILRAVAKKIYPKIKKEEYLKLASMSLLYLDSGSTFIKFLDGLRKAKKKHEYLMKIKNETKEILIKKKIEFDKQLEEIRKVFEKRKRLYKAYTYISGLYKKLYEYRIVNLTFEVDLVLKKDFKKLFEIAPICDYIYEFTDEDEYKRDYFGTSIDYETSQSLKVLQAYAYHYSLHKFISTLEIEKKEKHKCPFYTCCDLEIRNDNQIICNERPWRIYEISEKTTKKYCWYGQAMMEYKGLNEE